MSRHMLSSLAALYSHLSCVFSTRLITQMIQTACMSFAVLSFTAVKVQVRATTCRLYELARVGHFLTMTLSNLSQKLISPSFMKIRLILAARTCCCTRPKEIGLLRHPPPKRRRPPKWQRRPH